jgi:hypothetical protein
MGQQTGYTYSQFLDVALQSPLFLQPGLAKDKQDSISSAQIICPATSGWSLNQSEAANGAPGLSCDSPETRT